MLIGVLKESKEFEKRVALTPDIVKLLIKKGFQVLVETGAGLSSAFSDLNFKDSGAKIVEAHEIYEAKILVKVNPFTILEVNQMKSETVCISFLYAYTQADLVNALKSKNISAFSMDAVPRISRAQKMDALSSQANLAGYKAVLLGANALGKIFPLMMTAAGTITPAKFFVIGAGVAGLQAIATAKRLGGVVSATDVRSASKEQVESLGGKFVFAESSKNLETSGGYAKELDEEDKKKQEELLKNTIKQKKNIRFRPDTKNINEQLGEIQHMMKHPKMSNHILVHLHILYFYLIYPIFLVLDLDLLIFLYTTLHYLPLVLRHRLWKGLALMYNHSFPFYGLLPLIRIVHHHTMGQ